MPAAKKIPVEFVTDVLQPSLIALSAAADSAEPYVSLQEAVRHLAPSLRYATARGITHSRLAAFIGNSLDHPIDPHSLRTMLRRVEEPEDQARSRRAAERKAAEVAAKRKALRMTSAGKRRSR